MDFSENGQNFIANMAASRAKTTVTQIAAIGFQCERVGCRVEPIFVEAPLVVAGEAIKLGVRFEGKCWNLRRRKVLRRIAYGFRDERCARGWLNHLRLEIKCSAGRRHRDEAGDSRRQ